MRVIQTHVQVRGKHGGAWRELCREVINHETRRQGDALCHQHLGLSFLALSLFFFFLHCWSLIVLIRLLMKFLWRWDLLAWLHWKHYFASTIGSKWKDIVKVACEIWVFSFICVCVFCEHHHKNCSGNHLDRCPPHIFAMFAIFSALSFPWPKFTDQLSSL